jgi:hypothetical protein
VPQNRVELVGLPTTWCYTTSICHWHCEVQVLVCATTVTADTIGGATLLRCRSRRRSCQYMSWLAPLHRFRSIRKMCSACWREMIHLRTRSWREVSCPTRHRIYAIALPRSRVGAATSRLIAETGQPPQAFWHLVNLSITVSSFRCRLDRGVLSHVDHALHDIHRT